MRTTEEKVTEIMEEFYNDLPDTERWRKLGVMVEIVIKETIEDCAK